MVLLVNSQRVAWVSKLSYFLRLSGVRDNNQGTKSLVLGLSMHPTPLCSVLHSKSCAGSTYRILSAFLSFFTPLLPVEFPYILLSTF